MNSSCRLLAFCLALVAAPAASAQRADIIIADFEGETYGSWKAEGEAFGTGPARGTLPGQMPVGGFLGKGLVNSFRGGDDAKGKLTSPPFPIDRSHLNFLIGGGKYPAQTFINPILRGHILPTAAGPHDRPPGTQPPHPSTPD